jgi:hypothetical protein
VSRWVRRVGRSVMAKSSAAIDAVQDGPANVGEYQLLYKYLRDRYANRLVLTFAEIEDLLGFSLPDPARLESEWWSSGDPTAHRSPQSDSWILASRSATVNMTAQSVLFERQSPEAVRPK